MSPIYESPLELATYATAVRKHDWDLKLTQGAIASALLVWSWDRVHMEVCRLLINPDSSPQALTDAVEASDPPKRGPLDPKTTHEMAAACREYLQAMRKAS